MIERLLEAILTALLVANGGATAGAPLLTDAEDTDGQQSGAIVEEDGDGPPDFERIAALIAANVAAANGRAAAALEHAAQIREWTACIRANASNPEDRPRDDSFDPKIGCEDLRPATTPGGHPHGADDADDDGEAGPPSWAGGPPPWGPGPPPWAGAPTSGADPEE
jgi:hypothetical protein